MSKLVINIFVILCFIVSGCVTDVRTIHYFTIKGDPYIIEKKVPQIVILYQEGYCGTCTRELSRYVSEICKGTPVQMFVLVSATQTNIYSLRSNTDALMEHLDDAGVMDSFQIVYDLYPNERERVASRYRIKMYPSLLLVSANGKVEYIPYAKLFSDDDTLVSSKTLQRIADFAGVELFLK
ncbi:MAG: hypothetical protein IKN37_00230 [Bacteroidales bacterium]|nr:hypothetical protein [Bacteroidales bacterium]